MNCRRKKISLVVIFIIVHKCKYLKFPSNFAYLRLSGFLCPSFCRLKCYPTFNDLHPLTSGGSEVPVFSGIPSFWGKKNRRGGIVNYRSNSMVSTECRVHSIFFYITYKFLSKKLRASNGTILTSGIIWQLWRVFF